MPKTTAKNAVANAIQQPKGNEGQQMSVPTVATNLQQTQYPLLVDCWFGAWWFEVRWDLRK